MLMFLAVLLGLNQSIFANTNLYIAEVRRNIPLAEEDPVYKDFYINGGVASGLKKGLVVTAVRKINIRDASGASAVGEIMVPVGQLKIIAVFEKVAVAREFALLSRDELPMLEQIGIMTGDQVDLKGSFIDKTKPKESKAVANASETTSTATIVVTTKSTNSTTPEAPKEEPPVETAKAIQPKTPKFEEPTSSSNGKDSKPGA